MLYTSSHRIEGQVHLRERLSEALNDPLTDYLELTDAKISSLNDPGRSEVIWPNATIPKKTILIASLDLNEEEHESAATRFDKSKRKKGSDIGAIVDSIEIYGTAHLIFNGSARRVLTNQLKVYFPVTDATVILSHSGHNSRIEAKLALVNRDKIRAFMLSQ